MDDLLVGHDGLLGFHGSSNSIRIRLDSWRTQLVVW
jgi:hypothetical protein